jgi:hypothetical protein
VVCAGPVVEVIDSVAVAVHAVHMDSHRRRGLLDICSC